VSTIWVHLQDRKLERKGNLTGRREETEPLKTTLEPPLSRRERRESSRLPARRSVRRQRPPGRIGDGDGGARRHSE
jgi:hypothetical protein